MRWIMFFAISFCIAADLPVRHSSPTRRSSDLRAARRGGLVRVRGHGDQLRAARPARPQGDRPAGVDRLADALEDRKSTRLNSSHVESSYAVFCLKKKIMLLLATLLLLLLVSPC